MITMNAFDYWLGVVSAAIIVGLLVDSYHRDSRKILLRENTRLRMILGQLTGNGTEGGWHDHTS